MGSHLPWTAAGAVALSLIGSAALAAPPDACKLVTSAEVGAAVGTTMGPGKAMNGPTSSNCQWLQQGVDAARAVTVIVGTTPASAFEMGKAAMKPTPVAGLGDEAYLTGNSISYTALSVKRGGAAFSVMVRGMKDVAAAQAAEKAVAKVAVGRL
jgi:hypothetical protein